MRIDSQYAPLIMRLLAYNQQSVFDALLTLKQNNAKLQLINKICEIDLDMMDSMYQNIVLRGGNVGNKIKSNQLKKSVLNQKIFHHHSNDNKNTLKPLSIAQLSVEDKIDLQHKGRSLLTQGKVAIVFMCSGPSSRFYFQDKFLHPLDIFSHKDSTILEVLFEKLRENVFNSKNQRYEGRVKRRNQSKQKSKTTIDIPIVLIGNQTNTESIEQYLRENDFFNFNKHSIYFSTIPSLPILNKQGKICMNFEYNHLRRPQGSECCLEQIVNPQAMEILREKGVQYIHIVGTENLAQSPGDPVFIGLMKMLKRNVAIKCTKMSMENSKQILGKLDQISVGQNNRLKIISKFQLSQQQHHSGEEDSSKSKEQKQKNLLLSQQPPSYTAMNSMLFELQTLPKIVQKFNYNPQQKAITPSYRCYQIKQNFYDFKLKRPLVNQKCYTFEKDIKDTICVSDRPLVVEVESCEFIPIISHKGEQYGVQQAVEKFIKMRQQINRQHQEQCMKKYNYNNYHNRIQNQYQFSSLSSSSTKSIEKQQQFYINNNYNQHSKVITKQRHQQKINKNHQYLITE